jgi:adenine-specific DNA-methyltransferase
MQRLSTTLLKLLKEANLYISGGQVNLQDMLEATRSIDIRLLHIVLSNNVLCRHFCTSVCDVVVFDQVKFEQFLIDNFTKKVRQKPSKKSVVLDWTQKDWMLVGGQTKAELNQEEVFLNIESDKNKIEHWLGDKVFSDFRKYTSKGEEEISTISTEDNLIIKGDNLIVMHALKTKMAGKVKLIYIDPPYNTVTDGFKYNDNFSQTTWLTFIKNRIDVAKEMLGDNGFLFFHISFHQYAHIKVLLDEIFDHNHICTFNIMVRHADRILKGDKDFHDVIEYLLVYTKDKVANKIAKRQKATDIDKYIYQVKTLNEGHDIVVDGQLIQYYRPEDYTVIKSMPLRENFQKISIRGSLKEGNSSGRYYEKNLAPIKHDFPSNTLFKVPSMGNDMYDYRYFYTPEAGKVNGGYYQGVPINLQSTKEVPYPNFMDYVAAFNNVGYEGSVEFRNGKKPEALLHKVFELGKVKSGDIVMDFFLGSGTTAAVAHKMGIQYIGIEQIDYGQNDPIHRLEAVINGEQKGISSEIGWGGGGAFVTCKLLIVNDLLIKKVRSIDNVATLKKLINLWSSIHIIPQPWYENEYGKETSKNPKDDINILKEVLIDQINVKNHYLNRHDLQQLDLDISPSLLELNQLLYKSK